MFLKIYGNVLNVLRVYYYNYKEIKERLSLRMKAGRLASKPDLNLSI